ncbi:DegT/DnrJ/EryC1/StrS family aminotransferase [Burkholderia ubonensis]|uniref:DegT/DnrJ/EryC1/StrS family aminotransferase n=1 Tax=Burkholderia ubonensis TaxID=101571 RepID=UPI001FC8B741|nr:DegT/DnrJ/EryC1/StrS family aminotransferase [Burkholderia ubonensis]
MELLEGIWRREWLTNHGPLVNELEAKLKELLGVPNTLFLSNGTIALQIAIKALELKGEIITTPFSYVATTSSIVWEGCKPVMVDILPTSLTIDPEKIEAAITERTTAILATHVFGNACEISAIQEIADKHNLKVVYDAAHAFGTQYKGKSILHYGDISTTSYHATKLFHTVEGGGVFCEDPALLERMALLRNFGHLSPTSFGPPGINGKNSELHAAMGLLNLKRIDSVLAKRQSVAARYDRNFAGSKLTRPVITKGCAFNDAYYAVIFPSETDLLRTLTLLNEHGIVPRRYFYPSLSQLSYVEPFDVPVSEDISRRVLCLPTYYTISDSEVDMISQLVLRGQR